MASCFSCSKFDSYYTKGMKCFNKTKFGWCSCKRDNVYIHDVCDKYEFKVYKRKMSSYIKYTLSDLLTELTVIRNIIEEESRAENERQEM